MTKLYKYKHQYKHLSEDFSKDKTQDTKIEISQVNLNRSRTNIAVSNFAENSYTI